MLLAGITTIAALWLTEGLWHRYDPANPPETIYFQSCGYSRQAVVETLTSATAFEHQASAYRAIPVRRLGEDGGLSIYGLPVGLNSGSMCNGPWFVHLQVGPDKFRRYQRPGGP